MPIGLALVHVSYAQEHLFRQMRTHDLHADGEPVREAAWYRHARDARHVDLNREYIREIHIERVGDLLADAEGGGRCDRRDQRVTDLESFFEILADQRADFLRLEIVRVVIPGRECERAQHDAALGLRAEAFFA